MTGLPAYPDPERAVGDLLAALVAGGAVGSETPKGLQSLVPYIRITRTGGSDNLVTDTATISVDVFAADLDDAKDIAGQALQILTTPVSLGGVPKQTDHGTIDTAVTDVGPQTLPPADSDNLRLVVASYRVSMRRASG